MTMTKKEQTSASREARGSLALALTSILWGLAFVFQKEGGAIGTFSFMTGRFWIGSAVLALLALFLAFVLKKPQVFTREAVKGGVLCGLFYFAACLCQQKGLETIPAGVSGFLTAPYTVIVPLLSLFAGKKVRPLLFVCALLCLAGVFCLGSSGTSLLTGFGTGEILTLAGAFCWALQIMSVDHFSSRAHPVTLCLFQTLTAAVLSLICMFLFENPTWAAFGSVMPSLLYVGICSTGIAFTFQFIGQSMTSPAKAAILMNLESVFSLLGGWLILKERLTGMQYLGCAFILLAVMLSQLPEK